MSHAISNNTIQLRIEFCQLQQRLPAGHYPKPTAGLLHLQWLYCNLDPDRGKSKDKLWQKQQSILSCSRLHAVTWIESPPLKLLMELLLGPQVVRERSYNTHKKTLHLVNIIHWRKCLL